MSDQLLSVGAAAWIPAGCTQARYQIPSELMFGNGKASWLPVYVLSFESDGNSAIFTLEWDPSVKIKTLLKDTFPRLNNENVDDLSEMAFVNEGSVVQNLTRRFVDNQFFSSLGRSVYVSVNPIHRLVRSSGGYRNDTSSMFSYLDRLQKSPHVYHAADQLYRTVVEDLRSQSVILRGMSGSGKTECFKHIAQYMINVDGHRNPQEVEFPSYEPLGTFQNPFLCNGSPISRGLTAWIAVLELFGTAQTERNENSSRHSKLLRFHYGHDGHIENIDMMCLMLETSRVLLKDPVQRPFKIFQVLVSGTIHAGRAEAETGMFAFTTHLQDNVKGGKSFHARWEGQCAENLAHLKGLLMAVGLTEDQWQSVLRSVAAVMHLQCLVVSGSDSASISMTTKSHVGHAERLLGMETGHLMPLLLNKSTDGSMIGSSTTPLTPSEIKMLIDGMAAEIYNRTLTFLLGLCSKHVGAGAFEKMKAGELRAGPSLQLIEGYGYENISLESGTTPNGLMQFCINTLEERLQEQYLNRVFKSELDFLVSEGLPPIEFEYADMEVILSVLDRPPSGVMSLIEEASLFPRGSDNSLLDKVFSAHSKTRLIKSAGRAAKQSCFVVKHAFGDITYDTDGFTVGNKTKAPPEVLAVLNKLSHDCLAGDAVAGDAPPLEEKKTGPAKLGMFAKNSDKTQAKSGLMATKFRDGIGVICQGADRDTSPIYILCLKSSHDAKGFTVDPDLLTPQIRYLAITELAKFSKESFPYRKVYRDFYERYRPMLGFNVKDLPRKLGINDNHQALCKGLLRSCAVVAGLAKVPEGSDAPMFGETNIFLRAELVGILEESRFQIIQRYSQAAVLLQSLVRKFVLMMRFKKMKTGTIRMQAVARKTAARKIWLRVRYSALRIKSVYLTRKGRRYFNSVRKAVAVIKSRLLGKMIMRLRYKRIQKAVKMMHMMARGFIIRQQANHVILAILVIQRVAADFLLRNRLFYRRDNAVVTLQRFFRGWVARLDHAPEVNTLNILRAQRRAHRTVRAIQANFRRKLMIRRYREVYEAATVLQMWCRARRQRKEFVQVRHLNLWLQAVARRVIANNRVNALRLIVMMKEEFENLKEVRDKELALLRRDSNDPQATPQIGGGFYQDGHGKFVRFMFGFDVLLDTEEAYPRGWVKEVLNFDKQLRKQGNRRLSKIAVGSTHTVLVDSMSNVYTFGMGDEGQLGHGSRLSEDKPRLVETLVYQASVTEATISRQASLRVDVKSVCAGRDHTLLLTKSGRVYSWGSNRRGQLGHSNFQSSALPRMVGGMVKNAKMISCGAYHSTALVDPGLALIWGAKECIGCGGSVLLSATQKYLRTKPTVIEDISEPRSIPFFSKKRVHEIMCGDTCTFARSNNELYSWGNNNYGQLGTGNRLNRAEPILIALPAVVSKLEKPILSVGGRHAFILLSGAIYGWGWNKWGQVDGGVTEDDVLSPVAVRLNDALDSAAKDSPTKGDDHHLQIQQVTAGWRHSTALTIKGEVIAWGRAGLLFDTRDEEQQQTRDDVSVASTMRSDKRQTVEDELKAAAYLSPAPTLVNLPPYAAADRVLNLVDCHSSAISISAVEILFRDTINDKDIKIAKYVSKREAKPILYHTGGAKQQEYSQRFRQTLGPSFTSSSIRKSNENGSDSASNISGHHDTDNGLPKYLRLSSDSLKRSPNNKNGGKPLSKSTSDDRPALALAQRSREGRVTEEGLLNLFSPLRQLRRHGVDYDDDNESEASANDRIPQQSAIPFQSPPTGQVAKLPKARVLPRDPLQRQRSRSLAVPQADGGNGSSRRSSLSIDGQKRKGVLQDFAERQRSATVENARDAAIGTPPMTKSKSGNVLYKQSSEDGDIGGVPGGLSLSAVTDLAAMIQSIKKESLQNMTMQWGRY